MGQKVHPLGFRLGTIRKCHSKWYAKKNYATYLYEDVQIRRLITAKYGSALISRIEISRTSENLSVSIYCVRTGVMIGRQGADAEKLKVSIAKMCKSVPGKPTVNIIEVKKPELDATVAAFVIKQQLERRVSFRRAVKKALASAIKEGAKGIKIEVSGRLGGADMARKETYREGRVPLHTIRADVDYGCAEALTTYGITGVKVWIYRGEVFSR